MLNKGESGVAEKSSTTESKPTRSESTKEARSSKPKKEAKKSPFSRFWPKGKKKMKAAAMVDPEDEEKKVPATEMGFQGAECTMEDFQRVATILSVLNANAV